MFQRSDVTSQYLLTVCIPEPTDLGAGLEVGELALVAVVARPARGVVSANCPFFHAVKLILRTPPPLQKPSSYVYTYVRSEWRRDQPQINQLQGRCQVKSPSLINFLYSNGQAFILM